MENIKQEDIDYTIGLYDIIREKDLNKLKKNIINSEKKLFGVGVYDSSICETLCVDEPIKSLEDRMQIIQQIKGVDFVFPVKSLDLEEIKEELLKVCKNQIKETKKTKKQNSSKKYKLGYVPGTFDLFHCGHLENLMIAMEECEKIVVGVKSDDLVRRHKNKNPYILEDERKAIIENIKGIDYVYIYDDRDLKKARENIKKLYGKTIDAVYFGEDLKEDFKRPIEGLEIIFTKRPKELQEVRSTSAYRKKLGLKDIIQYVSNEESQDAKKALMKDVVAIKTEEGKDNRDYE